MKQILTLVMGLLYLTGTAQSMINYAYDANGNRTSRIIIMAKMVEDNGTYAFTESYLTQDLNATDLSTALYDGLDKARFVIYPNPARNVLNIKSLDQIEKPITASLLMQDGRAIFSSELAPEILQRFDLSSFSAGIYILVLTSGNSTINWTIIKN